MLVKDADLSMTFEEFLALYYANMETRLREHISKLYVWQRIFCSRFDVVFKLSFAHGSIAAQAILRLTIGTSGLRARRWATPGYATGGRHKHGLHATGLSTVCDPSGTAAPPLTCLLDEKTRTCGQNGLNGQNYTPASSRSTCSLRC